MTTRSDVLVSESSKPSDLRCMILIKKSCSTNDIKYRFNIKRKFNIKQYFEVENNDDFSHCLPLKIPDLASIQSVIIIHK